jgi:hypothetical protein
MTTFLIILLLLFSPQDGYTQDYYSGRKEVYGGDQIYRVTGGQKIVSVKNIQNRVRNEIRYKVGSDPVRYYTYATGMGHFADVDYKLLKRIVNKVFTEEECSLYTEADGFLYIVFAVNPEESSIYEIEFQLQSVGDDKTILSISPEKLALLEKTLKEEMVCKISDALREERQSYALAGCTLFFKKDNSQN